MMNCLEKSRPRLSPLVTSRRRRLAAATIIALLVCVWSGARLAAQSAAGGLSPQVIAQIDALTSEKASRTPVQRKISSRLLYAVKMARREAIASGVPTLQVVLPDVNAGGAVLDVRTEVTEPLLNTLRALGAEIIDVSAGQRNVRLRVGLQQVETIAGLPEVSFVQPKQEATTLRLDGPGGPLAAPSRPAGPLAPRKQVDRAALVSSVQQALDAYGPLTSVGSKNSEGDVTHKANAARATYGVRGGGVKVGVLSDGVAGLATSQALGDLGAVTVLAGQSGQTNGAEGTAMLEIVHDLAPDAELYFATAFTSIASFADNIRALRTAGCDIIVDDVAYFAESPFQDGQTYTSQTNGGIVTQAVKDVVASGALYFSSAANSGNKNDGQSGTWEGNFVDAGAAGAPLSGQGNLHSFGGGQTYNVLTVASANPIFLFWSDPLGGSENDYDLYRLNAAGTSIIDASTDVQDGDDDPLEGFNGGSVNDRLVVLKYSGAARFLHLATNRSRLSISTAGETHGHAATTALNSFGVAATPAAIPFTSGAVPGPYPNPFNAGNKVETFSSDGPRRLFYTGAGVAFTPGNVLASGGLLLQKPDLTAADGVSVTGSGGFPTTFYGTSAAAPHAAAIAALMKSRNLAASATQIRTALLSSAIDIEASGTDQDSGAGIIMADAAVAAVPVPTTTRRNGDFDGDGKADLTIFRPGNGKWFTLRSGSNYTGYSETLWGSSTDVPVAADYDGDGRTDIAIYRPSDATWWMLLSSTNFTSYVTYQWGGSGDIPVPRDYDGDNKADLAIYRPSTGTWWIATSSTNFTSFVTHQWGGSNDVALPGDYDGDGKADVAIYRPSDGTWWVLRSSSGYTTYTTYQWGDSNDRPVPADYDGDGKTDLAIYRPSTGDWWVLQSTTNYTSYVSYKWGGGTDVPVPADYDGDGNADVAIYRPTTGEWWWLRSSTGSTGYLTYQWGVNGDTPIR